MPILKVDQPFFKLKFCCTVILVKGAPGVVQIHPTPGSTRNVDHKLHNLGDSTLNSAGSPLGPFPFCQLQYPGATHHGSAAEGKPLGARRKVYWGSNKEGLLQGVWLSEPPSKRILSKALHCPEGGKEGPSPSSYSLNREQDPDDRMQKKRKDSTGQAQGRKASPRARPA